MKVLVKLFVGVIKSVHILAYCSWICQSNIVSKLTDCTVKNASIFASGQYVSKRRVQVASNLYQLSLTLLSIVFPYHPNTITTQQTIDVLQSEDAPNKFFFYEVYQDADAIAHHKLQPHYLAWGEFKESGGTLSSVSKKASGKFMT